MTASTDASCAPRRPGRPRDSKTHAAILEAAFALLGEAGFQGMSVQAVAERAGTSKATIYRWWGSKEALLAEALDHHRHDQPFTPSGDARADLVALLTQLCTHLPPRSCSPIARLVGAMADSEELAELFRRHLMRPRRAVVAHRLEAAIAEGLLPPNLDRELAIDQLIGPILYRHLVAGATVGPDVPERLVDALLAAHRPAEKGTA